MVAVWSEFKGEGGRRPAGQIHTEVVSVLIKAEPDGSLSWYKLIRGFDQTAWPSTPDITPPPPPPHTAPHKRVVALGRQRAGSAEWIRDQITRHYQQPLSGRGQRGLQRSPRLTHFHALLGVRAQALDGRPWNAAGEDGGAGCWYSRFDVVMVHLCVRRLIVERLCRGERERESTGSGLIISYGASANVWHAEDWSIDSSWKFTSSQKYHQSLNHIPVQPWGRGLLIFCGPLQLFSRENEQKTNRDFVKCDQ